MQLPSVYAHNFQLGHFNLNCLSSHGWRWTSAFWPLSWPVTSSLYELKYWGQTWLVMWSVSSLARYCFFSQTASAILLCSVCNKFGEASVKRCFASLFQIAIISMLQVWLEKLRCTPFPEVSIAYVSFVLGMKPSVVQYFGLSRANAL